MKQFHSSKPPKGFKPDFESFLFNTETHRKLQSKIGWAEFHLLDSERKKILASIFFNIRNDVAVSPFRAPFGSFQMSDKVTPEEFYRFVPLVEADLVRRGIKQLEIICPPEIYSATQPLITSTLLNHHYRIARVEPGCCIVVDSNPLVEKMFSDKKTRLKQGIKAELTFRKIPVSKLKEIYGFIEACRKERKQELSMTFKELKKTIDALPKSFFMIGAYSKDSLAAVSICIKVNKSIVYTFYSAHAQQYDKLSPLVFLLSNLYDWCNEKKVTLLDMGTSFLQGKPNYSLLDFKLRMGGTLTPRFRFQKILK